MSIRLYNPPLPLLARGNREGVDIGGSLSILGMDINKNIYVVENIFSELSWGVFYKNDSISDQIESITVKHDDSLPLYDKSEFLKRLENAFDYIIKNNMIFFGIADFEANSFEDAKLLDMDYKYINELMNEHKRIRNEDMFPRFIEEKVKKTGYINILFHGNGKEFFHHAGRNLYEIYRIFRNIKGNTAGIVCTSQGAANFYILVENIRKIRTREKYRVDIETLNTALSLIRKNVIFPISWFRIDLGLYALKTLENWKEIREEESVKLMLTEYVKYAETTLRDIAEGRQPPIKEEEIRATDLAEDERKFYVEILEELLNMGDEIDIGNGKLVKDMGLFKKEKSD